MSRSSRCTLAVASSYTSRTSSSRRVWRSNCFSFCSSTWTVIVMFAMPGSIVSEVVMLSMLKLRRLNIFEIRASTP